MPVKRGSVLRLRGIEGAGQRAYLAILGGFDVPEYMGSRATFTLGQFGGHGLVVPCVQVMCTTCESC